MRCGCTRPAGVLQQPGVYDYDEEDNTFKDEAGNTAPDIPEEEQLLHEQGEVYILREQTNDARCLYRTLGLFCERAAVEQVVRAMAAGSSVAFQVHAYSRRGTTLTPQGACVYFPNADDLSKA
jgi:hypothetical protein